MGKYTLTMRTGHIEFEASVSGRTFVVNASKIIIENAKKEAVECQALLHISTRSCKVEELTMVEGEPLTEQLFLTQAKELIKSLREFLYEHAFEFTGELTIIDSQSAGYEGMRVRIFIDKLKREGEGNATGEFTVDTFSLGAWHEMNDAIKYQVRGEYLGIEEGHSYISTPKMAHMPVNNHDYINGTFGFIVKRLLFRMTKILAAYEGEEKGDVHVQETRKSHAVDAMRYSFYTGVEPTVTDKEALAIIDDIERQLYLHHINMAIDSGDKEAFSEMTNLYNARYINVSPVEEIKK